MIMSVKIHDGQTQVVEGSAVGHFFVTPKMEWGTCGSLIYLGECKTASNDSDNKHYLQKFIYDANYNLIKVLIAQNLSKLNCTNVTLKVLTDKVVQMTLNVGDLTEVNKDDGINIKTPTQSFGGRIFKLISDTVCHIETNIGTSGLVDETNVNVNNDDIIARFEHEKTKFYTNRRWDHRDRYLYA